MRRLPIAQKSDLNYTACARFAIHLLLMTSAEEAELNFIEGEGAIEITQEGMFLCQKPS